MTSVLSFSLLKSINISPWGIISQCSFSFLRSSLGLSTFVIIYRWCPSMSTWQIRSFSIRVWKVSGVVVGQTIPPKDIQVLILEAVNVSRVKGLCKCVKNLEMGRVSWIVQVALDRITNVLRKGRWGILDNGRGEGHMMTRQSLGWCGHKPRNANSLQRLKEAGMASPLWSLQKESILSYTLIFSPTKLLGNSGLQNYDRVSSCCFEPWSLW